MAFKLYLGADYIKTVHSIEEVNAWLALPPVIEGNVFKPRCFVQQ